MSGWNEVRNGANAGWRGDDGREKEGWENTRMEKSKSHQNRCRPPTSCRRADFLFISHQSSDLFLSPSKTRRKRESVTTIAKGKQSFSRKASEPTLSSRKSAKCRVPSPCHRLPPFSSSPSNHHLSLVVNARAFFIVVEDGVRKRLRSNGALILSRVS